MRDEIPYDTLFKKGTSVATAQDIWKATVKVYTDLSMTEYIPLLKQQLLDEAKNVKEITDWLGW